MKNAFMTIFGISERYRSSIFLVLAVCTKAE